MRTNFRNALAVFVVLTLCFAGQLCADAKQPAKMKASAVEVKMIPSDELTLPPEFHVSLYENLIERLREEPCLNVSIVMATKCRQRRRSDHA